MSDVSESSAPGINEAMAVVQRCCRRLLGDADAAEDAAQAVFLVYWRKRRQLRDHPHLLAWFQRTAVLVCRQELRSRRRRHYHEARQEAPATADDPQRDPEAMRILEEELAGIPKRYAEVLTRQYMLEQSRAQIAAAMQVPAGTVATWAGRGRETLKERLLRRGVSAGALAGLGALAPATAASVVGGGASLASPAATTLAEQALQQLLILKLKVAAGVLAALTLGVGGAVAAVVEAEPEVVPAPAPGPQAEGASDPVDPADDPLPRPWSTPASRRVLAITGPAPAGLEPLRHTVEAGETLAALSREYLGSEARWRELLAANPGLDPASLTAGQEVRIPQEALPRSLMGALDFRWLRETGAHTRPTSLLADPAAAPGVAGLREAARLWPLIDEEFFPVVAFVDHAEALAVAAQGFGHPGRSTANQLQMLWDAGRAQAAIADWAAGMGFDRRETGDGIVVHQSDGRNDAGIALAADGLGGITLNDTSRLLAALRAPAPAAEAPAMGLQLEVRYDRLVALLSELARADGDPLELGERLPALAQQPTHVTAGLRPEAGRWTGELVLDHGPRFGLRAVDPDLVARIGRDHQVAAAFGLDLGELLTVAQPFLNRSQRTVLAQTAAWLAPCSGDIALGMSWTGEPVDPQRPQVVVALGLADAAAFSARIAPLLQAQGFIAGEAAGAEQVWDGQALGLNWSIAIADDLAVAATDRAALAAALADPSVDDAQATAALELAIDLPALAPWLLPLARQALGDEPIHENRGTDPLRFGWFIHELSALLVRIGPEAGLAEVLDLRQPNAGEDFDQARIHERFATAARVLGRERLLAGIAIYRRGAEAALVYRCAGQWHLRANTSVTATFAGDERSIYNEALDDAATVEACFTDWRRIGPPPAELTPLPRPVLFDPAWLPGDAVIAAHLPRYQLRLDQKANQLRLVEHGPPVVATLAGMLAVAFWAEGERSLRELHYQALLARDRVLIADRHAARLAVLRRAAEALRAKARANAERWTEDYAVWPHDPGWLLREGVLDREDASLLAGRPIADAEAFQAVGHWQDLDGPAGQPDQRPVDELQRSYWGRLWTLELEPGWQAVISRRGLEVLVSPWPMSTDPNHEQQQPPPDAPTAPPPQPPSQGDAF